MKGAAKIDAMAAQQEEAKRVTEAYRRTHDKALGDPGHIDHERAVAGLTALYSRFYDKPSKHVRKQEQQHRPAGPAIWDEEAPANV